MPLNYTIPPTKSFVSKVKDTLLKTFAYFFHPELFLIVFLLFSIIFEIAKRKVNWGWYLVFGIVVAGYFIERIAKIIKREKQQQYGREKQQS